MARAETFHGLIRFGLGASPGEADRLDGQIHEVLADSVRPGSHPVGTDLSAARVVRTLAIRGAPAPEREAFAAEARQTVIDDARTRLREMVTADDALTERLVTFWANHFSVSTTAVGVTMLAKPYVDEAIRPHVHGRFRDMLGAVVRHPAMLLYLDNAQSFSPHSLLGQRTGRGLNENLARELMELHTLGVDGGYTQDDVGALARILTGWSIARPQDTGAGRFHFYAVGHEPGTRLFLGRTITEGGEVEGDIALDILASHPSTARHVAAKLARHFISDDPPAAVIDRLAALYLDTDGDLAALTRALIAMPEAWADPLAKVRSPLDFIVAALRGLNAPEIDERPVQALTLLGQPMWRAPTPAGWPDTAGDWMTPEALMRRIEAATAMARVVGNRVDPRTLLEWLIGPLASADSGFHIANAASRSDGIALLLASPEFQRR